MNLQNFKEETIEKVLGFDIKVKTSEGKEKIIRFTNLDSGRYLSSTLTIRDEAHQGLRDLEPYFYKTIEFTMECLEYSMVIE